MGEEKHNAIYYESTLRKFDKEYLRIRKENNVYVLNYKNNSDKSLCEEYETIIDKAENMNLILEHLDMIKIPTGKFDACGKVPRGLNILS